MSEEEKQLVSQADFEAHKKETHKQLVQSAMLTFTAFLAIAAVCIAWFINNTAVSGGGVQVQTEGSRFVLASTGDKGRFDTAPRFIEGAKKTINGTEYNTTSGTAVAWMVSGESNIYNQADGKASLSPGSTGKITFYIIPQAANLGTINCELKITPYRVLEENETVTGEITVDQESIAPLDETENANIYSLLQGHVLFFRAKNGNNYSNWVQNGSFDVTIENPTKDKPQEITLNWIWPFQFNQYVSVGNSALFASKTGEYDSMMTEMQDKSSGFNYNKYFYSPTTALGEINFTNMNAATRATYSGYYNSADEAIGSSTRYFLLELNATEKETTA